MLSKLWREFCGVSLLLICLCELWVCSSFRSECFTLFLQVVAQLALWIQALFGVSRRKIPLMKCIPLFRNVKTMLTSKGGRGQFFVYKLTTIVYKLITPLLITVSLIISRIQLKRYKFRWRWPSSVTKMSWPECLDTSSLCILSYLDGPLLCWHSCEF